MDKGEGKKTQSGFFKLQVNFFRFFLKKKRVKDKNKIDRWIIYIYNLL